MQDMCVKDLIEEARNQTGLNDFGGNEFLEPLRMLAHALETEAGLTPTGFKSQRESLVHSLVTRLRMEDYYRRFPEIEDQKVGAPLFVVGAQRTGTTKLQRVLASDPQWHVMRTWEGVTPVPLDQDLPVEEDRQRRIAIARERCDAHNYSGAVAGHLMDPMEPEEEVLLIMKSFLLPPYEICAPKYHRWLETVDYVPAYTYLERQLKFLQWQKVRDKKDVGADKRWILKAGMHLHHLGALMTVFSDARLVQTHRDPKISLSSMLALEEMVTSVFSDTVDKKMLGRLWLRDMVEELRRSMAFRDANPDAPILDMAFRDVVADSLGTVKRIYAFADAPFTSASESAVARWEKENPAGKHGKHSYQLDRYGVDESEIAEIFGFYVERFSSYF